MASQSLLQAPKTTKGISEEAVAILLAVIRQAFSTDRNSRRDYALIKGSYLLGCRVSETAAIRWKDIEVLSDGGQIHLLGKGRKARTVRVSSDMIELDISCPLAVAC